MKGRRLRTWLITLVASLILIAATLSALFRAAVVVVPGYRQQLADWVGRTLDHPARIGKMNLLWRGVQPVLELSDVELLSAPDGAPVIRVSRLRLGFGLRHLLGGRLQVSDLTLIGLRLGVQVDADGKLQLSGIGAATPGTADTRSVLQGIARFDAIHLEDCQLTLNDALLDKEPLLFDLTRVDVLLREDALQLKALLRPPRVLAQSLTVNASVHGPIDTPQSWHVHWDATATGVTADAPWITRWLGANDRIELADAGLVASGAWVAGRFGVQEVNFSSSAIEGRHGGARVALLTDVQLGLRAQPEGGDWNVSLTPLHVVGARGVWPTQQWQLRLHPPAEPDAEVVGVDFTGDFLRLDDVAPWLGLWRAAPRALARLTDLRGDLHELRFDLSPPDPLDMDVPGQAQPLPLYTLAARFEQLWLPADGEAPGFAGLGGRLVADAGGGRVLLDEAPLTVTMPATFEAPVLLDRLSGEFDWHKAPEGWRLAAPQFGFRLGNTAGNGHFDLLLPQAEGRSPDLDLQLDFASDDAAALKPLLPKTMSANTRAWLQRAIQHARVPRGHLELQGPLADFPFVEHPDGHWGVDIDVADVLFAFTPGWAPLENLKAHVQMRGRSLTVQGDSATIGGLNADHASAVIADLHEGGLVVDGHVQGDAARFYSVLRNSPLHKRLGGLLDRTDLSGPAQLALHLLIPLSEGGGDVQASGVIDLAAATMKVDSLDAPIGKVGGQVVFGPAGINAEALHGQFHDLALTARIGPDPGSPEGRLDVDFDAPFDAADGAMAAYVPSWVRARLSGTSHWTASLPLSGADGGVLTLRSDLRGVRSDLPVPLRKLAGDSLPLAVRIGGDAAAPLRLLIGLPDLNCGQLCIALRFADVNTNINKNLLVHGIEAHFGSDEVPQAAVDGIVVTGKPAELDAAAWIGFLSGVSFGDAGAPPVKRIDLTPAAIVEGDFRMAATHLQLAPIANGWTLTADGDGARGTIGWSAADGGHVQARFDRVQLDPIVAAAPAAVTVPQPQPEQATPPDIAHDIFDPARAPTFDIGIEHLQVGGADLGHFAMSTARVANGQDVKTFKLDGDLLNVDGNGSWRRAAGRSAADSSFNVTSSDIGAVLKAFGYAPSVTGRDAKISGQLSWPDSPAGIDLKLAEGNLKLEVGNGSLTAVDPGAGRMLGLLNLYALPRRLTLDFSDVVSKGLGFDHLQGSFKLGGGNAVTDDMQITAPSMKMQIRGRVGLVARDYDEHVTVNPGISTGAVIGAGLAGGPAGVAIALVAQQLFNKPLDRLTRFSYRLTGSWDNPQIKRGDSTPAAAPGAAPAQPPADKDSDAGPDQD